MGLTDRDYMQPGGTTLRDRPRTYRPPVSRQRGTWAVLGLVALNVLLFLLQVGSQGQAAAVTPAAAMQPAAVAEGEVWRLLTATFLHADPTHLLFNMLGLYFLGPPLAHAWGAGRFVTLYLVGGVLANVVLLLAGLVGFLPYTVWGLGASGSVLTVVGATAVLYPRLTVLVFGILPMTLSTFALIYGGLFVFNLVQQGPNYGGDLCHLVGLILGAGWAWLGPWSRPGAWEEATW